MTMVVRYHNANRQGVSPNGAYNVTFAQVHDATRLIPTPAEARRIEMGPPTLKKRPTHTSKNEDPKRFGPGGNLARPDRKATVPIAA